MIISDQLNDIDLVPVCVDTGCQWSAPTEPDPILAQLPHPPQPPPPQPPPPPQLELLPHELEEEPELAGFVNSFAQEALLTSGSR